MGKSQMGLYKTLVCATFLISTNSVHAQPRADFVTEGSIRKFLSEEIKASPAARLLKEFPLEATRINRSLLNLADAVANQKTTLGVLLLQGNQIVYEKYNSPATATSIQQGFSITKSIVAYSLGTLICEGQIKNTNENALNHAPSLQGTVYGDARIHDLLTMRSGALIVEPSGLAYADEYNHLLQGRTTLVQNLSRFGARVNPSGKVFNYLGNDTQALSEIMNTYGGTTEIFKKNMWSKVQAQNSAYWQVDKNLKPIAWAGLAMTLRDWGRLAIFIGELRNGGHGECMKNFMIEATKKQVDTQDRSNQNGFKSYGFQTWMDPITGSSGSFWLLGAGGQYIGIDPNTDRILVVSSYDRNPQRTEAVQKLFDVFRRHPI
jgi:CubicO group peptidase (beta-lactamase class C family)